MSDNRHVPPVTKKEILGWCFYDVADSPFTTIMVTALFPLYFKHFIVGDPAQSDAYWGRALAISSVVVAVLSPLLGAFADFAGVRKRLLLGCAALVVGATFVQGLIPPGAILASMVVFIIANIGFGAGGVFIDSFLPGISTPQNAGRISGLKWAMGYLSGLIALAICLPLAGHIKADWAPADFAVARWMPWIIAGYFALAIVPTAAWLRDRSVKQPLPQGQNYVTVSFGRLGQTLRDIGRYRELVKLLLAFVLYNEGIVTVIGFATLYATTTVGFSSSEVTLLLLIIQVVAIIGALGFGWMADQVGQKRTILITLAMWSTAVFLAFAAPTKGVFYVVAVMAGLGIGSTQSVTRSLYAVFTPQSKSSEFFGFLGISGKALAFAGPLLFGELSKAFGSQRPAILAVAIFFVAGGALLLTVNEARGKAAAYEPEPGESGRPAGGEAGA